MEDKLEKEEKINEMVEEKEEEKEEGELADFTEKLCWVCQGTASLQCPQPGWNKQESLKL